MPSDAKPPPVQSQIAENLQGNVPFSPALNKVRLTIKALSLTLKRAQGQKVSLRLISRSIQKANMTPSI
jgi:hypothetical protein